jgi:hypothetical protein
MSEKIQRRAKNERKFPHWEDLPNGGRKYWYEVKGKFGFTACYVKEVNEEEETLRFYQEIYNGEGSLVEVHEEFPQDVGHRRSKGR